MALMTNVGSITVLLRTLKNGLEDQAAQQLFQRYIQKLEHVARHAVAGMRLHDRDERERRSAGHRAVLPRRA